MTSLQTMIFYATPPHDCSYITGEKATTMFVDPRTTIQVDTYSALSQLGFRRSGNHYYRPHCENCQQCIPVRLPVDSFVPSRSQKRVKQKNQGLKVVTRDSSFREEHYSLYERYINNRHADGDMHPPSKAQYESFLVNNPASTFFAEFWDQGCLVAVSVIDELNDGLSAIYAFYDPDYTKMSPGVYNILWQVEECIRRQKSYIYLGYYIKNCQKMNYKINYRPIEMFINGNWVKV
ncbi:MAG: arginyltransferase [Hahellaceae bacterium]|jgi:arginine-tRNA-protein transferase|nr:arginyltransferase [Hahellaceae bacterium]MCP5212930.1 arginyltransferase [Hahellaceae bacterium]